MLLVEAGSYLSFALSVHIGAPAMFANRIRLASAAGVAIIFCSSGLAQNASPTPKLEPAPAQAEKKAQTLKAGDIAPALSAEVWVKGDPVTGFEKGRVYVIEFWATWCGPCIQAIPHLTNLQKQYAGKVQFIGVAGSEAIETVQSFVQQQGEKIGYAVAFDSDRSMNETWMKPAGRNGIPCSFVVDREGKLAWIGHPRTGLDAVVAKVVAGRFDPAAWAEIEGKAAALRRKAFEAGQSEDFETAGKALDELAALDESLAADAGLMKWRMLLLQKEDYPAAYSTANKLFAGPLKNDAESLKEIAWTILDAEGVANRDFDLALKIAERAVELENAGNGMTIEIVARAYWEKGDKPMAIEWQKKAVAKAGSASIKRDLEATLAKYEGR
jgi:thiol-disulfide isomerase/thioredoxin